MKSAFEHFSLLQLLPPNKKAESDFKKAVISLLPQTLAIYISNIFVKNRILYVCVNHEGVVFEMDYKLKSVKSVILQMIQNLNLNNMLFDKTRVYFKAEFIAPKQVVSWREKERSDGKFENHLSNQKLFKALEEVRELICKNR